MAKLDTVRLALQDPEVLDLMRQSDDFAEWFDADGNLTVDPSRPDSRWKRFKQQVTYRLERRKV